MAEPSTSAGDPPRAFPAAGGPGDPPPNASSGAPAAALLGKDLTTSAGQQATLAPPQATEHHPRPPSPAASERSSGCGSPPLLPLQPHGVVSGEGELLPAGSLTATEDPFYEDGEEEAEAQFSSGKSQLTILVGSNAGTACGGSPEASGVAENDQEGPSLELGDTPQRSPSLTSDDRDATLAPDGTSKKWGSATVRFSDEAVYHESPWEYDLLPYLNNCEMPDLDGDTNPVAPLVPVNDAVRVLYAADARCGYEECRNFGVMNSVNRRGSMKSLRFWKSRSSGFSSKSKRKRGLFDDFAGIPAAGQRNNVVLAPENEGAADCRSTEGKGRPALLIMKGLALLKNRRAK